jgi:hypothetical protein
VKAGCRGAAGLAARAGTLIREQPLHGPQQLPHGPQQQPPVPHAMPRWLPHASLQQLHTPHAPLHATPQVQHTSPDYACTTSGRTHCWKPEIDPCARRWEAVRCLVESGNGGSDSGPCKRFVSRAHAIGAGQANASSHTRMR